MKKIKIISLLFLLIISTITINVTIVNGNNNDDEIISFPYDMEENPPELSTSAIIADKEFEKVDVTKNPYKKIVLLRMGIDTDNNGTIDKWHSGSGFLVYADIILTAGHCILTNFSSYYKNNLS